MAGLAYLLLPVSGIVAYLGGRSARVRFHGLQAIALGLLWPVGLFAAALISPYATAVVMALGALAWIVLMVAALAGRDPRLPWLGARLAGAAQESPRAET